MWILLPWWDCTTWSRLSLLLLAGNLCSAHTWQWFSTLIFMMIAIWSTWGVHTPSLTASTHHPPFTPFHINTKWVSCWWLNIKWVPSSRAAVQCWVGNVDKTNVRRRIMSYLSSRCENVVKSRWRLANFTQLSHLIHFKLHLNQFEISFDTLKWHSKSGFVVFKLDWSRESELHEVMKISADYKVSTSMLTEWKSDFTDYTKVLHVSRQSAEELHAATVAIAKMKAVKDEKVFPGCNSMSKK